MISWIIGARSGNTEGEGRAGTPSTILSSSTAEPSRVLISSYPWGARVPSERKKKNRMRDVRDVESSKSSLTDCSRPLLGMDQER